MADSHYQADRPAWREVVRARAQEAAVADAETYWGDNEVAFNYRWEHVQAVVRLALRLAELTGADREVVEAAAWLHDVAKPQSKSHGQDGAVAARQILAETDFPPEKIETVADAIEKHVGLYTNEPIEPLEAAVVWDADKLSKLGATAVLHFIGYQVMVGEGTTAELVKQLPAESSWQQHTARSFQTAPAQEVAQARLIAYRAFWEQALQEFDGGDMRDG
jgi:uncharacterized protein